MLMMVAVAVTWAATVPIMVKAISAPSVTLVALPKRRSKRSGMEVTLKLVPTADIRPAKPEKNSIPTR